MSRAMLITLALLWPIAVGASPPAVKELQDHIRTVIDEAEPSLVALVVSTNPAHGEIDPANPGKLGEYQVLVPPAFGPGAFRGVERNKLDLSDPRNAVDHQVGTGIVLDDRAGLILTTYHLIEGARKIFVRYSNGRDGYYADILAADERSDLAVLKLLPPAYMSGVVAPGLKAVKFGDVRLYDGPNGAKATVHRGLWVVALGHPLAAGFVDGQASASWGIISNIRRRLPTSASEEQRTSLLTQYASLIQTDARIALGSSGGALFNLEGEFIGLCTSTAALTGSEASGGYAIPMGPIFRNVIDVLRSGREVEYGFLGVSPGRIYRDLQSNGLEIMSVTDRSPADRAGLRPGDVILAVNDRPVKEVDDLFMFVGGGLAGNEVKLTFTRGGGPRTTTAVLSKFIHPNAVIASNRPSPVHGLRVEYTSLLAQQNGPGFRNMSMPDGVIVKELLPNSPAARKFKEAGLGPGKVLITRVNGEPVQSPPEFYKAAMKANTVTLTVIILADPTARVKSILLP